VGVDKIYRFDDSTGISCWFVFECDGPGCDRWLEIEIGTLYRARLYARAMGWDVNRSGQWFCQLDADLADEYTGPHEEWCPWLTRHAGCACRALPQRPLLTGSSEPFRRIVTVKLKGEML
jgi:hypothetical protein